MTPQSSVVVESFSTTGVGPQQGGSSYMTWEGGPLAARRSRNAESSVSSPPDAPVLGPPESSRSRSSVSGLELTLAPVPENYSNEASVKLDSSAMRPKASLVHRNTWDNTLSPPDLTPSSFAAAATLSTTGVAAERSYRRINSKSVRFSTGSDSDEDSDAWCNTDMLAAKGRVWAGLTEFTNLKEIYRGRISLVVSAICKKSKRSVVLKAYVRSKLTSSMLDMIYKEIQLHGRVRNQPGVVELLGWFEDQLQVVLVLEHCSGGDLYRHLVLHGGQMAEEFAVKDVLFPLLKALSMLHQNNICHRDLKPENLFFAQPDHKGSRDLKIGDFGLASDLPEMRDRLGTLDYMAPEIILQRDETNYTPNELDNGESVAQPALPYTRKIDVWSLGIIAYELLCGKPPFEVASQQQTAMLIVWGEPQFPDHVSHAAKDFILQALEKNPLKRPSIKDLKEHVWISMHTNELQGARWIGKRTQSDLRASDTSALTQRKENFSLRGLRKSRQPVRKATTVRNLGNADDKPKTRRPVTADRTFSQPGHPGTNISWSASRAFRRTVRNHRSSAGSEQSHGTPDSSRDRRHSSQRPSDDSISEACELDSASKLSRPDARGLPFRSKRQSDSCVSEDSALSLDNVASRGSIRKDVRPGKGILKYSLSGGSDMEANAAQSRLRASSTPGSDEKQKSLLHRFLSSLLACTSPLDKVDQSENPQRPRRPSVPTSEISIPDVEDVSSTQSSTGERRRSSGASKQRGSRQGSTSGGGAIRGAMQRMFSRWVDDNAPWNTNGAAITGSKLLMQRPDEKMLHELQISTTASTKHRVAEYLVRRGGSETSRKTLGGDNVNICILDLTQTDVSASIPNIAITGEVMFSMP